MNKPKLLRITTHKDRTNLWSIKVNGKVAFAGLSLSELGSRKRLIKANEELYLQAPVLSCID